VLTKHGNRMTRGLQTRGWGPFKMEVEMKKDTIPETERMRFWVIPNKGKKQFKPRENCVIYKGHMFELNGFVLVIYKEKIVGAFKAKAKYRVFLGYFDDHDKDIREAFNKWVNHVRSRGYGYIDLRKVWDKVVLKTQTTKKTTRKTARSANAKGG